MTKITIIGAGNVGASAALFIAQKGLGDVVLVDIIEGVPQGKALDIWESMPLFGSNSKLNGTNNYEETENSDIVVIPAGVPRKPGMSRSDLLEINKKIVSDICKNVKQYSPNAIVIVVTNPLDVMCYIALKTLGFPKNKVIGMGGCLDSTRYRTFIADALNVDVNDIQALVLGGHGDSMVPLIKHTTIKGKSIAELLPKEKIEELVERTKFGGGEIVDLLKTGSAYIAPGVAIMEMVEAILTDSGKTLPCSAYLEGEYGINGVYIGVPCVLGKKGLKEIKQIELTAYEKSALQLSAKNVREDIERLKFN